MASRIADNRSNNEMRTNKFRVVNKIGSSSNAPQHGAGVHNGVQGSAGNSTSTSGMGNMGMGLGFPMGMGMYANPYNPLYWIQTVNMTIMQVSQMIQIFGMSTTALGVSLLNTCKVIISVLRAARKSKYVVWLQEKSKKSSLFKWTIIFLSMVVTSTVCSLVRLFIHRYCGCNSTSAGLLKMLDSFGLSHLLPKFASAGGSSSATVATRLASVGSKKLGVGSDFDDTDGINLPFV